MGVAGGHRLGARRLCAGAAAGAGGYDRWQRHGHAEQGRRADGEGAREGTRERRRRRRGRHVRRDDAGRAARGEGARTLEVRRRAGGRLPGHRRRHRSSRARPSGGVRALPHGPGRGHASSGLRRGRRHRRRVAGPERGHGVEPAFVRRHDRIRRGRRDRRIEPGPPRRPLDTPACGRRRDAAARRRPGARLGTERPGRDPRRHQGLPRPRPRPGLAWHRGPSLRQADSGGSAGCRHAERGGHRRRARSARGAACDAGHRRDQARRRRSQSGRRARSAHREARRRARGRRGARGTDAPARRVDCRAVRVSAVAPPCRGEARRACRASRRLPGNCAGPRPPPGRKGAVAREGRDVVGRILPRLARIPPRTRGGVAAMFLPRDAGRARLPGDLARRLPGVARGTGERSASDLEALPGARPSLRRGNRPFDAGPVRGSGPRRRAGHRGHRVVGAIDPLRRRRPRLRADEPKARSYL